MQEALLNNVASISKYDANRSTSLEKIWTLTQAYHANHGLKNKDK